MRYTRVEPGSSTLRSRPSSMRRMNQSRECLYLIFASSTQIRSFSSVTLHTPLPIPTAVTAVALHLTPKCFACYYSPCRLLSQVAERFRSASMQLRVRTAARGVFEKVTRLKETATAKYQIDTRRRNADSSRVALLAGSACALVSARASSQSGVLGRMQLGESVSKGSKRADVRRGRISHATYVRIMGQALPKDWFALETCEVLAQLELVDHLIARYPERYPSRGWAIRALLDKAIEDVASLCQSRSDLTSRRLIHFLEARRAGRSVKEIALDWGLSRECVSRTVGRQAAMMIAERVLTRNRRHIQAMAHDPVELPVRNLTRVSASRTA
jgi:hypothetical protein